MPPEEPRTNPTRPPGGRLVDIVLELSLLAGGLLILSRVLLRGLWHPPLAWAVPPLVVGALLAWRVRRAGVRTEAGARRPGRWREGVRAPALVLAGCFLLVIALLPSPHETLGPDERVYLEQVRGLVLHGRLSTHAGIEPGSTVLNAPFFALGHVVTLAVQGLGGDAIPDGQGAVYRNAIRLGGAVYGFLASVFAWYACRRFFSPVLCAVCVGGAWLSSTLFYYSAVEPVMPHAAAAALASLLLLLWLRAREEPRAGRWAAAAFVGGFLVSSQRYDAYLLLPVVLSGATHLRDRWVVGDAAARRRIVLAVAGCAAAFVLATVPLVFVSFALPGGFLLDPEALRTVMLGSWHRPHVGEALFSSNRGLFAWTPVALLGTLGLVVFARRERRVALVLLATLALGVVVVGSSPVWWAGWSFGARRLTEAFAIVSLGFCAFAAASLKRPRALGTVILVGLVAVNLSLSAQYRWGRLAPSGTISFTRAMQGVVADVYRHVGHPPSWPASWLLAARLGVSPDRFDDLYGQVPSEQWQVRLGTPEDAVVLGRGWSRPHGEGCERQRWAQGEDSTLLFALAASVDRRLLLHGAAARHPDGRVQGLVVEVNGRPAGRLVLTSRARLLGLAIPATFWSAGLNEVRFRPEWTLSRRAAWETSQPAHVAWRAAEVRLEPIDRPTPQAVDVPEPEQGRATIHRYPATLGGDALCAPEQAAPISDER